MSQIRQPEQGSSSENLSKMLHGANRPDCHRAGRKRSNKKKRCRSRTSVDDDSCHSDSCNPNAFWQNYQKVFQWGKNQEVAYWRSKAVALEFENKMLRQHIQRLSLNDKVNDYSNYVLPVGVQNSTLGLDQSKRNFTNTQKKAERRKKRRSKKHSNQSTTPHPEEVPEEDVHDSQLEFEVSEEMKDFFELHMRHKMEQEKKQLEDEKKFEEAATAAGEENAKLISHPLNFGARADELKLLYGDASPMIHGMETAMQLTFRRHCEKTGARLWPNIPLRL